MKKVLLFICVIFSLTSFGQIIIPKTTPNFQQWGSPTTWSQFNGFLYPVVGFVNSAYTDTTTANLNPYLKNTPGVQIRCGDEYFVRDAALQKWFQIYTFTTPGGGGAPTDTTIWRVSGNGQTIVNSLSGGGIGSANNVPIWLITNGQIRIQLPASGLTLSNDTTNNKVFTFNPTTKNWGYANWVGGGGSAGWNLTGNAGTDTALNFVGTTDDEPLRIKVNNQQSGLILNNSPWNTYFGYTAGSANTSGAINVGIGWGALRDNVTGSSNVAIGLAAIQNATNSNENVAIGYGALANIENHRNVAVGTSAMTNSRDADQNTSVGNYSMLANRQGDYVNAFGSSALRGNVDGSNNVGIGNISLTQNTTAIQSISVTAGGTGYTTATVVISAPIVASDPNNNSLQATATATLSGGAVVSITITEPGKGYSSFSPPTATISGDGSGATLSVTLTSGEYNTGVGVSSLVANRTGKYNSAIGYGAGGSIDTGSYNLFLGSFAGNHVSQKVDVRSSIAIGPNAYTTANNQFVISDSITSYKFPNISSGAGTKALRYDPATDLITIGDTSTATTSLPISSLTAATTSGYFNSGNNGLQWDWNTLGSNTGLRLFSSSTAASGGNQTLLSVDMNGANVNASQTTYSGYFTNAHTGTSSSNVALYASATSGTNNYAIIVPSGSGSVGIGTSTPTVILDVVGATQITGAATVTTSVTSPLLIGSTAANGTLTMKGNSAGASNTATNANIIMQVGNTPTKAMDILNNGLVRVGSNPTTTSAYGMVVDQDSDAGPYRGIWVSANNHTTGMAIGYGGLFRSGGIVLESSSGGIQVAAPSGTGLSISTSATAPTSTLDVRGSFQTAYRAITALRTLDATDKNINCTSGTFTVTLPTAVSIAGREYTIVNSGSGTITIGTTSSQTFTNIDATPTTLTLAPVGAGAITSYTVVSNGANWIVTAKVKNE